MAPYGYCIWVSYPFIFANLREVSQDDWREFVEIRGF